MDKIKRQRIGAFNSGQAVLEYILLLAIVISMFVTLVRGLKDNDLFQRLVSPLTKVYPDTYRYGYYNPSSSSQKFVAQDPDPASFRIFVNPPTKK